MLSEKDETGRPDQFPVCSCGVKVFLGGASPNRTYTLYSGTQVISEFSDASTATYTSGTTPGQAPSDSVSLLLYQHHDHMNTRVATDQQGNVAYQRGNYPYGDQWYDSGPPVTASVARKLTKYRLEPELTASVLNAALYREHSARMGRFHTPDVKSGNQLIPQRMNRYSYASNDPINRWDPQGLNSCPCVDDCDDWPGPVDLGFGCDGVGGGGGCGGPSLDFLLGTGDFGSGLGECEPPPAPPQPDVPCNLVPIPNPTQVSPCDGRTENTVTLFLNPAQSIKDAYATTECSGTLHCFGRASRALAPNTFEQKMKPYRSGTIEWNITYKCGGNKYEVLFTQTVDCVYPH